MQISHDIMPHRPRAGHARDIAHAGTPAISHPDAHGVILRPAYTPVIAHVLAGAGLYSRPERRRQRAVQAKGARARLPVGQHVADRSEEHTSELQSLMRISYAVFCLKNKKKTKNNNNKKAI